MVRVPYPLRRQIKPKPLNRIQRLYFFIRAHPAPQFPFRASVIRASAGAARHLPTLQISKNRLPPQKTLIQCVFLSGDGHSAVPAMFHIAAIPLQGTRPVRLFAQGLFYGLNSSGLLSPRQCF